MVALGCSYTKATLLVIRRIEFPIFFNKRPDFRISVGFQRLLTV